MIEAFFICLVVLVAYFGLAMSVFAVYDNPSLITTRKGSEVSKNVFSDNSNRVTVELVTNKTL